MTNQPLATTYRALLDAAKARGVGREGQIEAARFAFYQGFVAEQIDGFLAAGPIPDASGKSYSGLLRGADMAGWHATIEPATAFCFRGLTIYKPGPWSQGPVLLQTLALLDQLDGGSSMSADNAHLLVEAMKLAFADREAWYGDSHDDPPPIERLLSKPYNEARARLIGETASEVFVPGTVNGCTARLPAFELKEHKPAKKTSFDRDTCHLNVIDRWGNMVSATPSGGWLYGSPALPGLGLCLSTRGQMFWVQRGLASSLRPGRRPRTTMSPTLLVSSSGERMALGTKGADYADQWLLQFIINHYVYGFDLQASVDAPLLASEHWPDSVAPRRAAPNRLLLDSQFPESVREALRARGHDVITAPEGRFGRTCVAALRNGIMHGAVTTRLPEAAVIGR
jgi:gamma-glutamyltranspeptidase/glutathione hydrolase